MGASQTSAKLYTVLYCIQFGTGLGGTHEAKLLKILDFSSKTSKTLILERWKYYFLHVRAVAKQNLASGVIKKITQNPTLDFFGMQNMIRIHDFEHDFEDFSQNQYENL